MRLHFLTALTLSAAVQLGAQSADPKFMGIQVRGTAPMENLKDATGGKPGFGASVFTEQEWEDGWLSRIVLGGDVFGEGNWTGRPGVKGKLTVSHLSVEGVKMLRPDIEPNLLGPYILLGAGLYGWSLTTTDTTVPYATTRRVVHLGGAFGFGYRFTPNLDAEIRTSYGRVDPTFSAGGFSVAVNCRF